MKTEYQKEIENEQIKFETMNKYIFVVGSNNETKKLELEKIQDLFNSMFDGFSISFNVGFWKRTKEQSCNIAVLTTIKEEKIKYFLAMLKADLEQESILIYKEEVKACFF